MHKQNQSALKLGMGIFFICCSLWFVFTTAAQAVESAPEIATHSLDDAVQGFSDSLQPTSFFYNETPCPFFYATTTGTIGTKMTIVGDKFGSMAGKVYVGEKKSKVLYWSDTMIMSQITGVITPPGRYNVVVAPKNKNGEQLVCPDGFEIMAPEIAYIQPLNSTCENFYMVGKYFGTKSNLRIYFRNETGSIHKAQVFGWQMDYSSANSYCFFNIDLVPGDYSVQVENNVGASKPVDIVLTETCEIMPQE